MKILTLMENTTGSTHAKAEHGLCLYIETKKHKILADTGQFDLTWENAALLGVDLTQIDTVFISHGHYDHTGGLGGFSKINSNADIYIQQSAAKAYYHGERYIGIDPSLLQIPHLHLLKGSCIIDSELEIFSEITGRRYWPESNLALSEAVNNKKIQDQFVHEQCLVIHQDNEYILISGCAHNGILNILDRFKEIYHQSPSMVISGFHMMKKTDYTEQEISIIRDTAKELLSYPTIFYSGHCTGQQAFDLMKEIMGDQLRQMHAGDAIL